MESLNFECVKFDESIEKPKWHYTYNNTDISGHPIIFECDANDILEADKKYEEKVGRAPDKQNHISCSIIKN